jgi:hypothetical protein
MPPKHAASLTANARSLRSQLRHDARLTLTRYADVIDEPREQGGGKSDRYDSDEDFLTALDERSRSADADV